MNQRQKNKLMVGTAIIGGILLWLLLRERQQYPTSAQSQTVNGASPPDVTANYNYNFNTLPNSWPGGWYPPPVVPYPGENTINVNVNGAGLGTLAGYFPLFGFVGIDTTQLYQ